MVNTKSPSNRSPKPGQKIRTKFEKKGERNVSDRRLCCHGMPQNKIIKKKEEKKILVEKWKNWGP